MNRIQSLVMLLVLAWGLLACGSEPVEVQFFTEGNCEACGQLIQQVLEDQRGVKAASWDFSSSLTTVRYDPSKLSEDALQEALAAAGFRTGYFEPDTTQRNQLPACCRESINRKLQQQLPTGH